MNKKSFFTNVEMYKEITTDEYDKIQNWFNRCPSESRKVHDTSCCRSFFNDVITARLTEQIDEVKEKAKYGLHVLIDCVKLCKLKSEKLRLPEDPDMDIYRCFIMWLEDCLASETDIEWDTKKFITKEICIAKDSIEIAEDEMEQFMRLIKRLPLYNGYEDCEQQVASDVFYAVSNEERGIELLFCKNEQNTGSDTECSGKSTIRMEIRYKENYDMDGSIGHTELYSNVAAIFSNIDSNFMYEITQAFNGYSECCFLGLDYAKEQIDKSTIDKQYKDRMKEFMDLCNDDSNISIGVEQIGKKIFADTELYEKVKDKFEACNISPASPQDSDGVIFVPSVKCIFGVCDSEQKKQAKQYRTDATAFCKKHKKTKKKVE